MWPIIREENAALVAPFAALSQSQINEPLFVYFDIGSVLIDLHWDDFFAAVDKLLACASGQNALTASSAMQSTGMKTAMHLWCTGRMGPFDFSQAFCESLGFSQAHQHLIAGSLLVPSALDIKEASSRIVGPVRARSLRIAKELRSLGVGVGVLSNAVPWHETDIEATLRLRDVFDVVVFSQDVGYEKPSPEIYATAHTLAQRSVLRKHRKHASKAAECQTPLLKKSNVYFVDDTPINILAAQEFGWNASLVCLLKEPYFQQLLKHETNDEELLSKSTRSENLLFGDEAAQRVENLFSALLSSLHTLA